MNPNSIIRKYTRESIKNLENKLPITNQFILANNALFKAIQDLEYLESIIERNQLPKIRDILLAKQSVATAMQLLEAILLNRYHIELEVKSHKVDNQIIPSLPYKKERFRKNQIISLPRKEERFHKNQISSNQICNEGVFCKKTTCRLLHIVPSNDNQSMNSNCIDSASKPRRYHNGNAQQSSKSIKKRCRNGPYCEVPNCRFMH